MSYTDASVDNEDLHLLVKNTPHVALPYTIFDHSSYSGPYHPGNICINEPNEQSSRWSSNSHDQSQYITIQLEEPTVVCEILFGKFHRSHVCNLKEFKIYGGMDPNDMRELLHKGLTDDNQPEVFPLRYTYHDLIFPVQYIKIKPMATFGANFNYSIWYVEVRGIQEEKVMSKIYNAYNKYIELETIRLCLKHFRQKNMMSLYDMLQQSTKVQLEHPLVHQLHKSIVIEGDFDKAEHLILEADKEMNIFKSYVEQAKYKAHWQWMNATNDDGDAPCARGGHQMCIDVENDKIYLLGGWDGTRELADFWCYHIPSQRWKLISSDTSQQGGPTARSCHTICFDPLKKSIFVLGRYIETTKCNAATASGSHPTTTIHDTETTVNYHSEFFQYFTELDRWQILSENTLLEGGPPLLCDHQMCVDPVGRTLYVFGGRVISQDTLCSYGGLYAYDLDTSEWRILRHDMNSTPQQMPSPSTSIKSRTGHSMLLDSTSRCLYIFGGQRGSKENLSELFRYDIEQDKLVEIAQDFARQFGSNSGYTQRASIDMDRQELYIASGFVKDKPNRSVSNCLWVYRIQTNQWEKVFEREKIPLTRNKRLAPMEDNEPCPRYTFQMVYHPGLKTHYLFGGHPGDIEKPTERLDDFWELKLTKPDTAQIARHCLYLLRTRRLQELSEEVNNNALNTTDAFTKKKHILQYLREYVAPIVDHHNKSELKQFQLLCTHLCMATNDAPSSPTATASTTKMHAKDETNVSHPPHPTLFHTEKNTSTSHYDARTFVFQSLLEFFPSCMKEPEGALIDAVKIK
ncbi:Muskelin N-terminus-domain-containing protein [Mycotypha africana]|uniref:Muskelin N-terminus-domain-containing protein n=1 Tax=Mycotypha africana TaxID=64632 RepID=UPI0023014B0E|nr:Muskelin N-terminus-domain-containing protein [Mycotypha africana]KAI8967128.1 Muskelin N-terminus-domain-containing protein [Mycotypha africana]